MLSARCGGHLYALIERGRIFFSTQSGQTMNAPMWSRDPTLTGAPTASVMKPCEATSTKGARRGSTLREGRSPVRSSSYPVNDSSGKTRTCDPSREFSVFILLQWRMWTFRVPYNGAMSAPIGPIYLLADSALLFSPGDDGSTLPESIRALLDDRLENKDAPTAAYIGASNRDEPAFYGIFEAAMDSASITERRMIRSRYSAMDNVCLNASDLIVLAGGDVAHGWRIMQSTGMRDVIVQRYLAGAVLVGVSAGAVQLGLEGVDNDPEVNDTPGASSDTFRLVPFVIDVHDEDRGWERLRERVDPWGTAARGLRDTDGRGRRLPRRPHPRAVRKALRGVVLRRQRASRVAPHGRRGSVRERKRTRVTSSLDATPESDVPAGEDRHSEDSP